MEKPKKRPICVAPYTGFTIIQNNQHRACCYLTQVHLDSDIKKSWNSTDMIRLRSSLDGKSELYSGCKHCISRNSPVKQQYEQTDYLTYYDTLIKRDDYTTDFKPYHVTLSHSRRCNLACMMCYPVFSDTVTKTRSSIGIPILKNDILDYKESDLDIEELLALRPKHVVLIGGEPMLDPNIDLYIDTLKTYESDVSIITNGTVSKTKNGRTLVDISHELPVVHLTVSIDGVKEVTEYQRIYASFDRIQKTLLDACTQGNFDSVKINIVSTNIASLGIVEFLEWYMDTVSMYNVEVDVCLQSNDVNEPYNINPSIVYATSNLPPEIICDLLMRINETLYKYRDNAIVINVAKKFIQELLMPPVYTKQWNQFINEITLYDEYLNRDILDLFPILKPYWNITKPTN